MPSRSRWLLRGLALVLALARAGRGGRCRGRCSSTAPSPPRCTLLHIIESGWNFEISWKFYHFNSKVAFKTGDFNHQVIFIGGLTDGFLATDYLEPLSLALEVEKWSLVQPLLSSSYTGYGISSLEQDALELDQLISYLINKENSDGVILLGHSTGCQDIVHYMRTNFACSKAVSGVILQAPVSDREYRATLPETAEMIDLAAKMLSEGRGMDLMPREANPDAPITAYRYHSLCAYMGDDDMFSSDLSEDQLRQRLGHMSTTQCQVIFSMGDEYVPEYVDKEALVDRLCRALGNAEKVEIEWGNHALSNRVQEAVRAIVDFVKREGPKGWDDPWS
uniref:AB hydrolase-1 domain-containing protein n=1 Tax=Oryza barthii TaxID=65489 RepID=A0A0D3GNM3_9ORYZ